MRGSETACRFTVGGWVTAVAPSPSVRSASRVRCDASATMKVPAANATPPAENAESATLTRPAATFQGRTAERQSPRCGTTSTCPVPAMVPVTVASAVSIVIGLREHRRVGDRQRAHVTELVQRPTRVVVWRGILRLVRLDGQHVRAVAVYGWSSRTIQSPAFTPSSPFRWARGRPRPWSRLP